MSLQRPPSYVQGTVDVPRMPTSSTAPVSCESNMRDALRYMWESFVKTHGTEDQEALERKFYLLIVSVEDWRRYGLNQPNSETPAVWLWAQFQIVKRGEQPDAHSAYVADGSPARRFGQYLLQLLCMYGPTSFRGLCEASAPVKSVLDVNGALKGLKRAGAVKYAYGLYWATKPAELSAPGVSSRLHTVLLELTLSPLRDMSVASGRSPNAFESALVREQLNLPGMLHAGLPGYRDTLYYELDDLATHLQDAAQELRRIRGQLLEARVHPIVKAPL